MILIDADALRQRMYHEAFEADTDMQRWDSGCWIRYKLFENCLDSMPAISNAVLRPVGKWIAVTNGRGGHECGVCHDYAPSFQDGSERLSNFCPNCGADMREES